MKRLNIVLLAAMSAMAAQSSAQQLILDGQAIDLDPNLPVTIEEDGDIVAFSAAGDLICANVTSPPTVNLGVTPLSIVGSGNVTVSWTTQFAESCTPTGGGSTAWSSTSITPLASGQTTLIDVDASTTFTLTCDNVLGMDFDSASVTVSTGGGAGEYAGFPPPADCGTTQPPPAGTSHQVPLEIVAGASGRIAVANNFEGALGAGWPGDDKEDIYIGAGNWLALGFIAEQAASCTSTICNRTNGTIEWESSILPNGVELVSISRCPGDFDASLGPCRSDRSPVRWSYGPSSICALTPGEQYYLNIIHGTAADPATSTCGVSECGVLLNVR